MSWWRVCAERSFTEHVEAAPDDVRAFYVDLDNIKFVHPLVVSVRALSRSQTTGGYVQSYRIRDRIPLGPVTLQTSYLVRLCVPTVGDVAAEARQFPGVRLHSTVRFEDADGGTRVTEHIRIEAPRPLATLTVREAVSAHIAMLSGIRRWFQ